MGPGERQTLDQSQFHSGSNAMMEPYYSYFPTLRMYVGKGIFSNCSLVDRVSEGHYSKKVQVEAIKIVFQKLFCFLGKILKICITNRHLKDAKW